MRAATTMASNTIKSPSRGERVRESVCSERVLRRCDGGRVEGDAYQNAWLWLWDVGGRKRKGEGGKRTSTCTSRHLGHYQQQEQQQRCESLGPNRTVQRTLMDFGWGNVTSRRCYIMLMLRRWAGVQEGQVVDTAECTYQVVHDCSERGVTRVSPEALHICCRLVD